MKRLLLSVALLGSTGACASVLDFQDPIDRVADTADGGDTSSNALSPTSSSSSSSSSGDVPKPTSTSLTKTEPPDASAEGSGDCACFPSAPNGWRGPFILGVGAKKEAPSCVGDYAIEAFHGYDGYTGAPAECACSCGAPSGVACSVPVASFFDDNKCATGVCHTETTAQVCGGSYECAPGKLVDSVSFGPSLPSGGACTPSATVRVPPVAWTTSVRLCAPASTKTTCQAGCQPTPSPVFSSTNRCVTKLGDLACPSAYPVKQVFHANTDTRACSTCECGSPTGTTCSANAVVLSNTCKVTTTAPVPTACLVVSGTARITLEPGTANGGACAPTGGQPIGALVEGDATTVCCLE